MRGELPRASVKFTDSFSSRNEADSIRSSAAATSLFFAALKNFVTNSSSSREIASDCPPDDDDGEEPYRTNTPRLQDAVNCKG